ncbi:hypothetical protein GCM10007989_27610 [Devosia pacifica]|uniref:Uncharacterized protein n=1 Tax=Devosia pacifica TaxID=1335967 RepID=A0A918S9W6_9HYPH|nr:hypothetical protein [Devosia pacifica]GHA30346.1 hypothetical protein GCM10007989_27610 [Devosia pacifica]
MSNQYQARNGLTEQIKSYTLTPTGIDWWMGERRGSMSYADIVSLRLIRYASPGGTTYQCTIRSNGQKLQLRSQHYRSLGAYEDRRLQYAAFVRELLSRLADRDDIKFIAGSTALWMMWIGVLVLNLGLVLILVLVIFDDMMSISESGIPALFVVATALPLAWRSVRKGYASRFDPRDPPEKLLGVAASDHQASL